MRHYLVTFKPFEEEASNGRYFRGQNVHELQGVYTFESRIMPEGGNPPLVSTVWPTVQFVLYGAEGGLSGKPVGAPLLAPPYRVTIDLPAQAWDSLQACLYARVTWPAVSAFDVWVQSVAFQTGDPTPLSQAGWMWVPATKFEGVYSVIGSDKPVRVWYPGHQINRPLVVIPPKRLRPRPAPYTTIPLKVGSGQTDDEKLKDFFWVEPHGTVVRRGLMRRFSVIESVRQPGVPRACVAAKEQYDYFKGVSNSFKKLGAKDQVPLIDGPRYTGQLAHGWHGWIMRHEDPARSGGTMITCTNGRIVADHDFDGRLSTYAGRRMRAEDNFAGPGPTTAKNVGLYPSPLTWGTVRDGQMENVGDFKDGLPPYFSEPWASFPLGAYPTPHADVHHEEIGVVSTLDNYVARVDHRPCHLSPGAYPVVTRWFADFPKGAEPWSAVRIFGTDDVWVTAFMEHALYLLDAKTGALKRKIVSAQQPSFADIGVPGRGEHQSGIGRDVLVTKYVKDGPPGVASFIFPQAIDQDSTGNIIFACRYTRTLHRFNAATEKLGLICKLPVNHRSNRDISLAVTWDGQTGPTDHALVVEWDSETDVRMDLTTGGWVGRLIPTRNTSDMLTTRGPLRNLIGIMYPTLVVAGLGRIRIAGTGSCQGLLDLTPSMPSDPKLDVARYGRGYWLWLGGSGPSWALSHGEEMQGHLGLPNVDDIAAMRDVDAAAWLRAGGGTGVPRTLSNAQVADLLYMARWNSVARPDTTTPPVDVLPPAPPTLSGTLEYVPS